MIRFKHTGSFKHIEKFFARTTKEDYLQMLARLGQEGVNALASATPTDTGKTANSWNYEIVTDNGRTSIFWTNSNINDGVNIAVILQYGHGTGTGGYVQGIDYINPAIRPVFDKIAQEAWKGVTTS